jgi:hypothetical protein
MANILKSTYNATNEDLKNYFNVKKNNKWSGYGSYSTLTNSEKENLRRNLLNDLSKRVSRNNSAMGIVTYPKINGPSAPPLPNATVMNPNTGKITNVPVYNVTRNEFETLKGNVNKLKRRSGLGGAAFSTLETGANVTRRGAKYAGEKAVAGGRAVGGVIVDGARYLGNRAGNLKYAISEKAQVLKALAENKAHIARNATREIGHAAVIGTRSSRSNQYVANKFNALARGTHGKSLSKLTPEELQVLLNAKINNAAIPKNASERNKAIRLALAANKTKFFFRRRY